MSAAAGGPSKLLVAMLRFPSKRYHTPESREEHDSSSRSSESPQGGLSSPESPPGEGKLGGGMASSSANNGRRAGLPRPDQEFFESRPRLERQRSASWMRKMYAGLRCYCLFCFFSATCSPLNSVYVMGLFRV